MFRCKESFTLALLVILTLSIEEIQHLIAINFPPIYELIMWYRYTESDWNYQYENWESYNLKLRENLKQLSTYKRKWKKRRQEEKEILKKELVKKKIKRSFFYL